MSRLTKTIRSSTKRGNSIPAIIVDITSSSKASARLAGRGAIYRNLEVVGGPAQLGDLCYVDMTTPKPTIVMTGKTWLTEDDLNRALRKLPFGAGGGAFDIDQIFVFSSVAGATGYPRTSAGLADAFSGSAALDKVVIPAGIITGSFTLPAGVEVFGMGRNNTSIAGQVIGADGASLNDIAVEFSTTSSDLTYAVLGPSTGIFRIDHCICNACNQGSGNTYGLWQLLGGHTDIDYATLRGECYGGGLGYAAGIEEEESV